MLSMHAKHTKPLSPFQSIGERKLRPAFFRYLGGSDLVSKHKSTAAAFSPALEANCVIRPLPEKKSSNWYSRSEGDARESQEQSNTKKIKS